MHFDSQFSLMLQPVCVPALTGQGVECPDVHGAHKSQQPVLPAVCASMVFSQTTA